MIVNVNGVSHEFTHEAYTIFHLIQSLSINPEEKGIALALNGEVVPKTDWKEVFIQEQDFIEIVHARQGG